MIIYDFARGSAFVTDLRLAWIRYFHRLAASGKDPIVVQLLGTTDTMVRRVDCLDTEQFPKSFTVDVPDATHADLYRLERAKDPEGRYALIAHVFRPLYQPPVVRSVTEDPPPTDVIFILHGIRASNTGWVEEASSLVRAICPNALTITAQYGYFSALHFFLPWVRRTRARWFLDRYSAVVARFPDPKIRFHFIGHSNGTYMLGQGLEKVSMMRFERAYLAGSVLPPRYPWNERAQAGQIKELRSDCSAWDWPVALLCGALSFMGDIGTGGFSGFEDAVIGIREHRYYPGGHSKPLEDRRSLESIVRYVLTGEDQLPASLVNKPNPLFAFASRVLRYFGPVLLVAIAFTIGYCFWTYSGALSAMQWTGVGAGLLGVIVIIMSL